MQSIRQIARLSGAVAIAAAACFGGNAQAKLVGDSITATYYYPNLSTPYDMGTVIVGSGVEFNDLGFTVDVSDYHIEITSKVFGTYNQSSFNGFTLVDNTNPHAFDELKFAYTTFDSNLKNSIKITGNMVSVNWGTFFTQPGYKIMLEVPEPASYGMLLAGLGLLSVAARRKKKVPAGAAQ
ncbi:PEP-CTERM sorting domain-containing protein [Rugamonas sp. CCM 8940]|uniref:PEP-CTERM sorting domain-containing protein n=1 Tax=Rugamonas sp. CCM 8940 TaxID=2765359 RepID=UPI0018F75187|nr:PEP-CTERM sorting domain-containing protein [Rugamonas sp. CCM 8940]MBJ7312715.1 PEP-CTERM sorting domain-containing protein [Rugamonas sp. CCM 8940]